MIWVWPFYLSMLFELLFDTNISSLRMGVMHLT